MENREKWRKQVAKSSVVPQRAVKGLMVMMMMMMTQVENLGELLLLRFHHILSSHMTKELQPLKTGIEL